MITIQATVSAMRSATMGESLAREISDVLLRAEGVTIDFSSVEMMTPSYANAFIMTLLDRFDLSTLQSRCTFLNRSEAVIEAMNRAIRRYQSGIRLTTQRVAPHVQQCVIA